MRTSSSAPKSRCVGPPVMTQIPPNLQPQFFTTPLTKKIEMRENRNKPFFFFVHSWKRFSTILENGKEIRNLSQVSLPPPPKNHKEIATCWTLTRLEYQNLPHLSLQRILKESSATKGIISKRYYFLFGFQSSLKFSQVQSGKVR